MPERFRGELLTMMQTQWLHSSQIHTVSTNTSQQ